MKKNLYILAVACLALASCSNDETVATRHDPNEISFRPLIDGTTRSAAGPKAGGTNFETGDVINVYADFYDASATSHSKYFQADFTKQSTGGFTSVAKYYWPTFESGDKLTFTAIYGATQKDGTAGIIEAYSPATEAASQMDVMVAKKETTAKEPAVVLNFRHALSQIEVKVKNSDATLDFDITGVRIGYVSTTGNFTYSGGVTTTQEESGHTTAAQALVAANNWTPAEMTGDTKANSYKYDQTWTTQTVTAKHDDAVTLTSFNSWLLIPQTQTAATAYTAATQGTAASNPTLNGSYIALELEIYNYTGSTRSSKLVAKQWCYWPCAFTWTPGFKYTYTVDLAGGGYQPINTKSAATTLDKVLGDVIVFSPVCSVDYWVTNDVTM